MIIQKTDNIIEFSHFGQFPSLVCGMTTRGLGDKDSLARTDRGNNPVLTYYNITPAQFVTMNQIHGEHIEILTVNHDRNHVHNADGMTTDLTDVFLGVNVADCVPLFFYDPKTLRVGVAHAGWRGTLSGIASNMISVLKSLHSEPSDIYVVLGPHIGGCCYRVGSDRAQAYIKRFGLDPGIVWKQEDAWHIDIAKANMTILEKSGVLRAHISAPICCTSCQKDRYYSFRRDNTKNFGQMVGIIGTRSTVS